MPNERDDGLPGRLEQGVAQGALGLDHVVLVEPDVEILDDLEVAGLVEKPKPEVAPSNLSIIGRYVLMPQVVDYLARMDRGAGNELQLTDAMAKLIGLVPFHGLRYEGRRFDCGDKVGFLEAQLAFALKRPDLAPPVRDFLRHYVGEAAEAVA